MDRIAGTFVAVVLAAIVYALGLGRGLREGQEQGAVAMCEALEGQVMDLRGEQVCARITREWGLSPDSTQYVPTFKIARLGAFPEVR